MSRRRARRVIEHCGLRFRLPPPSDELDERILYLGDDVDGAALEVVAVELSDGALCVIHAMPLRAKYRLQYGEARKWQR